VTFWQNSKIGGGKMEIFIGITCGWEEKKTWHKLHDEYVSAVREAGGIPLLLPSVASSHLVDVYYNQLDGFIFSGGSDIDPHYFGEEPQEGLGEITPVRDAFEMALAKLVLEGDKPALGICRGIQLLNIAAGGDIYQDLKSITGQLHNQQAPREYPIHTVKILADSSLFRLAQKESVLVNSFHHQGIRRVGKGLRAVAWSEDGLIEAVESCCVEGNTSGNNSFNDKSYGDNRIIAVQWHPECNWFSDRISFSLFRNLVESTRKRKGKKLREVSVD
jgi:putative glutamine amidotransferase